MPLTGHDGGEEGDQVAPVTQGVTEDVVEGRGVERVLGDAGGDHRPRMVVLVDAINLDREDVVAFGGQENGRVGRGDQDFLAVQDPDSGREGAREAANGDEDARQRRRREPVEALISPQATRGYGVLHQSSMVARGPSWVGPPVTFSP